MPFSWLRVAKAQEGRAEQEAKEKAARENVWTRDSDLMGKLKAQEEEVRVGGDDQPCPCTRKARCVFESACAHASRSVQPGGARSSWPTAA